MLIPKAKRERRRNLSITRLPLLTHSPSCTDCIPVEKERSGGTGMKKRKGENHHLHERGPRGREAAAEEGLGPAEPNKAGLKFYPAAPRGGGGILQHPLSRR